MVKRENIASHHTVLEAGHPHGAPAP